MTVTMDQFLAGLSELASGINNVVVATYNNLNSHPEGGELSTGVRRISIVCGGAAYANLRTPLGYIPNEGAQATKATGVDKVSDGLAQIASRSLVVLYAGKSRFNEIVRLARRLADSGVKVALVSCGCDENVFGGLEANENISLVVPTHDNCNGGRDDLSRIVKKLLN